MRTVKDQWDSYATKQMPKGAGLVQRREMCRAFYAGAWSYFTLMSGEAASVSDDEGAAMIEQWRQEMLAFTKLQQEPD